MIDRYLRVRFPLASAKIDQETDDHLKNLSYSGPARKACGFLSPFVASLENAIVAT